MITIVSSYTIALMSPKDFARFLDNWEFIGGYFFCQIYKRKRKELRK